MMRSPMWMVPLIAGLITAAATRAQAVPITVVYVDGATEGFNDAILGAARRNALEFAASLWAQSLAGSVTIVLEARFDPLGGSATSAILGSAGATFVHRDYAGAPRPSTWYASSLANQLGGDDLNGGAAEIEATFNSDVDGTVLGGTDWYYGTDAMPGGDIDFVTVALHELGHGLHFFDTVDDATGAWSIQGFPDIYGRQLFRGGAVNLPFDAMTSPQRLAAIVAGDFNPSDAGYLPTGEIVWTGAFAAAAFGSNVPMYAPDPYEGGSSISHFAREIGSNPLMEPSYNGAFHKPLLSVAALRDLGWSILDADADTVPDGFDNCPLEPNLDQADGDGDGIGDVCEEPPANVPAVGPSGLATMTLLVLTGALLAFHRRRPDVAAARE